MAVYSSSGRRSASTAACPKRHQLVALRTHWSKFKRRQGRGHQVRSSSIIYDMGLQERAYCTLPPGLLNKCTCNTSNADFPFGASTARAHSALPSAPLYIAMSVQSRYSSPKPGGSSVTSGARRPSSDHGEKERRLRSHMVCAHACMHCEYCLCGFTLLEPMSTALRIVDSTKSIAARRQQHR